MNVTLLAGMVALAAFLGGCTGTDVLPSTSSTATTQTTWTGPPPSGPCAAFYDPTLGSQVLAYDLFSDQGAQHAVPMADLIRINGADQEFLDKSPTVQDCVRFVMPSEGTYSIYERTADNYYGQENCFWHGGSGDFVHDGKPYYEVTVHMNFQCAHA